jgi:Ferritin-like domain
MQKDQLFTLGAVDLDGAIEETAAEAGATRLDFIKRGGAAGAGLVAGGAMFSSLLSPAEAAISKKHRSKRNDIKILNYALTLEYLESEFYLQADTSGAITEPHLKAFASTVRAHEAAHVKTLKGVLGSKAVKKPKFDFGDAVTNADKFRATAQILEDTGVAAYAGQGPHIFQVAIIKAALAIHSVEARHAAWIRYINSDGGLVGGEAGKPAPKIVDKPKSEAAVLKAAKPFFAK